MKFNNRQILLFFLDVIIINLSFIFAFFVRFDFNLLSVEGYSYFYLYITNIVEITIIKLLMLYIFGIYNSLWKYTSIDELTKIIMGLFVGTIGCVFYLNYFGVLLPKSIYLLSLLMDILLISGSRVSYRFIRRYKILLNGQKRKNVLIYGAGQAGAMLIKELKEHPESDMKPVVIIDDDLSKKGRQINGVTVVGDQSDLLNVLDQKKINTLIIAMPSASKSKINEIVELTRHFEGERKILPSVYEMVNNEVTLGSIRDVNIEDLLGRDVVKLDTTQIKSFITGKKILVTGGAGSIGSELVRQISKYSPGVVHLLDLNENALHFLSLELGQTHPENQYHYHIASIRERDSIFKIMERLKPDVIFHAAAHKHVPLMEANPLEAVKNNVFGTRNLIEAAIEHKVGKFVQISTDKAVNPTNVMGATKRICEMMVQSSGEHNVTEFVAVRFGNVLGSNGSVIPIFKEQILKGGPVTLTHPDITRYFMTIPEAASLVLQAGAMAKGGEIFVLDMGQPVKIYDLAVNLIRLSGYKPNRDIEIKITGLRPGEKMYEELLIDDEAIQTTTHKKIFVENPIDFDHVSFRTLLGKMENLTTTGESHYIREMIHQIVPSYHIGD